MVAKKKSATRKKRTVKKSVKSSAGKKRTVKKSVKSSARKKKVVGKKRSVKKVVVKKPTKKAKTSARRVATKVKRPTRAVKKPVKRKTSASKQSTLKLFLSRWVKNHPNGWNHDDWLNLLAKLSEKGYEFVPDEVGSYIEGQRMNYFGW